MKRTTIYLDEEIDLELARLARQEGRSKAELVREVLGGHVAEAKKKPFNLPDWVGMGHSKVPYTQEESEALLGRLIEEDHERVMADWKARQSTDCKDSSQGVDDPR